MSGSCDLMLIGIGLFLSGIILLLLAVVMLLRRRMLMAGLNGSAGFSLLSLGTILVLILLNAHTYHQLTREIQLAKVEIGSRTSDGLAVKIHSDQIDQIHYIQAKEWQLDARFLKWKSWAYLFGSEPLVRLETLSGRYSPATSGDGRMDRHQLEYSNPVLNELGSRFTDWLGMVDTYYGSSVYMPAVEGAVYSVSATISGLVARAENTTAKQAVSRWMVQ